MTQQSSIVGLNLRLNISQKKLHVKKRENKNVAHTLIPLNPLTSASSMQCTLL